MIMVDLDPRQSLTIFRTSSILLFVVLFATCLVAAIKDDKESFLFPNREHKVFNVIGSALRTEASVANPNGMSVFLAYVNKGSFLFHGTFKQDEVKGFEWVAFDPNFASLFARWEAGWTNDTVPTQPPIPLPHTHHDKQTPLALINSNNSADMGNLRTYKAKKDLRLLYLDGLSAIKRDDGPLDFQNIIFLSNHTITPLQDRYRVETMCEMNKNRWNGRIDGFIRKHYELEMILCSFEDSLEEINRITLPYIDFEKDMIWNPGWTGKVLPNEARDETITKANVHVNFDQFVSVWNYPIKVHNKEGQSFPRLNRIPKEEREIVLRAVDELVLGGESYYHSDFTNWQNIVDSIVARFKPVFQAFDVDLDDDVNRRWANKSARESVFVYVDVLNRSNEKEMQRCTNQMYKLPKIPTVASRSVQAVLQVLCSTLLDTYDEKDIRNSQKRLKQLSEILYWTPWTHYQRDKIEPW